MSMPSLIRAARKRLRRLSRRRKIENRPPEIVALEEAASRLRSTPLFDADWYLDTYVDLREAGIDPALHYVEHGGREGRSPGPLFDGGWYLERNPDVREAGVNPLLHYIEHGGREGRSAGPLFDDAWYQARYPDVRDAGVNPLLHYLEHGAREGRSAGPAFDGAWYLATYADVREAGANPLLHFARHGRFEGRYPGPAGSDTIQDTHEVRAAEPVVSEPSEDEEQSALIRLMAAHPLFDGQWYRALYRDVAAARLDPARHYLEHGAAQGRDPGPYFRSDWYAKVNAEAIPVGMNPFLHFILQGEAEGRLPRAEVLHAHAKTGQGRRPHSPL